MRYVYSTDCVGEFVFSFLGISHESLVGQLREQGNAAFKEGDWQRAVELYTQAIEFHQQGRNNNNNTHHHNPPPSNNSQSLSPPSSRSPVRMPSSDHYLVSLYSNRSAAYLKQGHAVLAMSDAHECIALKPDYYKGYSRLGAAYLSLQQYESAIATFQQGLWKCPPQEALQKGLAASQRAQQRAQERQQHQQSALYNDPSRRRRRRRSSHSFSSPPPLSPGYHSPMTTTTNTLQSPQARHEEEDEPTTTRSMVDRPTAVARVARQRSIVAARRLSSSRTGDLRPSSNAPLYDHLSTNKTNDDKDDDYRTVIAGFVARQQHDLRVQLDALQAQWDFVQILQTLTTEAAKLALLFNVVDINRDGTISATELAVLLQHQAPLVRVNRNHNNPQPQPPVTTNASQGTTHPQQPHDSSLTGVSPYWLDQAITAVAIFDKDGDARFNVDEFSEYVRVWLAELNSTSRLTTSPPRTPQPPPPNNKHLSLYEFVDYLVLQTLFHSPPPVANETDPHPEEQEPLDHRRDSTRTMTRRSSSILSRDWSVVLDQGDDIDRQVKSRGQWLDILGQEDLWQLFAQCLALTPPKQPNQQRTETTTAVSWDVVATALVRFAQQQPATTTNTTTTMQADILPPTMEFLLHREPQRPDQPSTTNPPGMADSSPQSLPTTSTMTYEQFGQFMLDYVTLVWNQPFEAVANELVHFLESLPSNDNNNNSNDDGFGREWKQIRSEWINKNTMNDHTTTSPAESAVIGTTSTTTIQPTLDSSLVVVHQEPPAPPTPRLSPPSIRRHKRRTSSEDSSDSPPIIGTAPMEQNRQVAPPQPESNTTVSQVAAAAAAVAATQISEGLQKEEKETETSNMEKLSSNNKEEEQEEDQKLNMDNEGANNESGKEDEKPKTDNEGANKDQDKEDEALKMDTRETDKKEENEDAKETSKTGEPKTNMEEEKEETEKAKMDDKEINKEKENENEHDTSKMDEQENNKEGDNEEDKEKSNMDKPDEGQSEMDIQQKVEGKQLLSDRGEEFEEHSVLEEEASLDSVLHGKLDQLFELWDTAGTGMVERMVLEHGLKLFEQEKSLLSLNEDDIAVGKAPAVSPSRPAQETPQQLDQDSFARVVSEYARHQQQQQNPHLSNRMEYLHELIGFLCLTAVTMTDMDMDMFTHATIDQSETNNDEDGENAGERKPSTTDRGFRQPIRLEYLDDESTYTSPLDGQLSLSSLSTKLDDTNSSIHESHQVVIVTPSSPTRDTLNKSNAVTADRPSDAKDNPPLSEQNDRLGTEKTEEAPVQGREYIENDGTKSQEADQVVIASSTGEATAIKNGNMSTNDQTGTTVQADVEPHVEPYEDEKKVQEQDSGKQEAPTGIDQIPTNGEDNTAPVENNNASEEVSDEKADEKQQANDGSCGNDDAGKTGAGAISTIPIPASKEADGDDKATEEIPQRNISMNEKQESQNEPGVVEGKGSDASTEIQSTPEGQVNEGEGMENNPNVNRTTATADETGQPGSSKDPKPAEKQSDAEKDVAGDMVTTVPETMNEETGGEENQPVHGQQQAKENTEAQGRSNKEKGTSIKLNDKEGDMPQKGTISDFIEGNNKRSSVVSQDDSDGFFSAREGNSEDGSTWASE